jgi:hypothetical protein
MLSASDLKSLISYDPGTGLFTRLNGRPAGTRHHRGYIRIKVLSQTYSAHRLAWLWAYGKWPEGEIDHIDRDPSNNRVSNLRIATRSQNCANRNLTWGKINPPGTYFERARNRWVATIKVNGRRVRIGAYADKTAASKAYVEASLKYFGEFSEGLKSNPRCCE